MEEIKNKVMEMLISNPTIKENDYLTNILENAVNDVLDFINWKEEDLDMRIATPVYDLCVYRYNLTGNEGVSSSSKASQSETFQDDFPKSVKRKLMKYRNLP